MAKGAREKKHSILISSVSLLPTSSEEGVKRGHHPWIEGKVRIGVIRGTA